MHRAGAPQRVEDGRITSRGHSVRGAIMARCILWESNVDIAAREQVCALVRHHQLPFHLINRPDSKRIAFHTAHSSWAAAWTRTRALAASLPFKAENESPAGLYW